MRKIIIAFFTLAITITAFNSQPVFSEEYQKIPAEKKSGVYETRMDMYSSDMVQGLVIEETPKRKKKRILPFFIWAGGAYLAFNATKGTPGNEYDPMNINEDEFYANLNLRCLERSPVANSLSNSSIDKYKMGADISLYSEHADLSFQRADAESRGFTWSDGNLIGRLNPLFISVKQSSAGYVDILVAGLDKLDESQIARIELSDDETVYTLEIDFEDGNEYGVLRASSYLDFETVKLSIELIR